MATNLLLEGDDLEALLLRAHREGGASARIVRAEKVRQGGVMGFFAKEHFEVAVEIPGVGDSSRTALDLSEVEDTPQDGTDPARADARDVRTLGRVGAGDSFDSSQSRAVAELLAQLPSAPSLQLGSARAAVDSLLELADRVSAAEDAASHAALAAGSRGSGAPWDAVKPSPPNNLRNATDSARESYTSLEPLMSTNHDANGWHNAPGATTIGDLTVRPDGAGPRSSAVTATATLPGSSPSDASIPSQRLGTEPTAPASRPEFTALLEQLRQGTLTPTRRPGRSVAPSAESSAAGSNGLAAEGPDRAAPKASADPSTEGTRGTEPAPSAQGARIPALVPGPRPIPIPLPAAPAPHGGEPAPNAGQLPVPPAGTHSPTMSHHNLPAARRAARLAKRSLSETSPEREQTDRVTKDRQVIAAMGVPMAWTRLLRSGERFAQVLRMLERMPDPDIDPEVSVVAVVGSQGVVHLEAHRVAIDLATSSTPRPVTVLMTKEGARRGQALAKAATLTQGVVAIETEGYENPDSVVEALRAVKAGAVIVVVDATRPVEATQAWIDAIGQIDAVSIEGATTTSSPAAVLALGLPVIRLDGIPVDKVTWAALICAHLEAANPSR